MIIVMLFGMSNMYAQETKKVESKDSKISEVILLTEMHCQNCADKVSKQLAYTKGVIDVQASHEKNAVYIKYRNDRTDESKLIASLKEIGYEAKVFNANHSGCPHSQGGACSGHHQQQNTQETTHQCSGNHDANHQCSGHKN